MGYFLFGVIGTMSSDIIMLSTVIVVAFLITAELITGLLEYTVSDSPIYNKMLLKIYKELMFLGIVSFILLMIESSQSEKSTFFKQTLIGVDYCHIMLFYVAIFFVLHVVYLLLVAARSSKIYRIFQKDSIASAITEGKKTSLHFCTSFFFRHHIFPSKARNLIEFKIVSVLFADSYSLPDDFNFSAYVKGCFEFYALKTVDVGIFSWMVVILLFVANYARIKLSGAFNCDSSTHTSSGYFQNRRFLAGTENNNIITNPINENAMSAVCHIRATSIFLMCGLVSIIFTLILYFITKYQWIQLIRRVGVRGPNDYVDFLTFYENEKKKQDTAALLAASMSSRDTIATTGNFKVTNAMLKKNIEELLDENESVPNDEIVMYKNIINFLKLVKILFHEKLHDLISYATNRKEKLRKARENRMIMNQTNEYTNHDEGHAKAQKLKSRLSIHASNDNLNASKANSSSPMESRSPSLVQSPSSSIESPSRTSESEIPNKRAFAQSIVSFSQLNVSHFFSKDRKAKKERFVGLQTDMKSALDKKTDTKIGNLADANASNLTNSNMGNFNFIEKKKNSKVTEKSQSRAKRCSVVSIDKHLSAVELYKQKQEKEANLRKLNITYDTTFLKLKHYFQKNFNVMYSSVVQFCKRKVDVEESVEKSLNSIFLFGMKSVYYRTVEIGIMFNCLYASLWATFFLTITNTELDSRFTVFYNLLMIVPFLILVPLYGEITKTASLMLAITDLDLEVIHKCIKDVEETERVVEEFREKIKTKLELIKSRENGIRTSLELLRDTFDECDEDGSKYIDRVEFRKLLRFLHLSFTDRKFNMLYHFVDINGDDALQINEIEDLIFSKDELKLERGEFNKKYSLNTLIEGNSESDSESSVNNEE